LTERRWEKGSDLALLANCAASDISELHFFPSFLNKIYDAQADKLSGADLVAMNRY
jgi:hypothetical protein